MLGLNRLVIEQIDFAISAAPSETFCQECTDKAVAAEDDSAIAIRDFVHSELPY
ncbi:hypothetical protein D3C72_2565610 [compost metagenome]